MRPLQTTKIMTTAIANLLPLTDNAAAAAAKNGMTAEQFAASQVVCNNKDLRANPECLAILKDRAAALAAFDRITLIPETDAGSPYIPSEQLIAAILA